MVVIREEIASDIPAICHLNEEKYGQPSEPDIVDSFPTSFD